MAQEHRDWGAEVLDQLPAFSKLASRGSAQDKLYELEYELSSLVQPGAPAEYALVQCFALLSFEYDAHGVFVGMERDARASASQLLWKKADHQLDSDMLVTFADHLRLQNMYAESDQVGAWALGFPLFHGGYRPYMWRLRAEAMRAQGRWSEVLGFIKQGEASAYRMPGDIKSIRNPALVTLHGFKATVLLGLGLLDQAAREIELGFELVEAGSWFQLMLLSKRADLYLHQERYAEVEKELVPILKDWPVSTRDKASLLDLRAHLAFARSELSHADAELALRTIEELNVLVEAGVFGVRSTVKLWIELCDLYLRKDDLRNARRALDRASECLGPLLDADAQEKPLFEHAMLAAYNTQLLFRSKPTIEQLKAAEICMEAAFDNLLMQWSRAPAMRSGGIGFLEPSGRRFLLSTLLRLRMEANPGEGGVEAALESVFAVQARSSLAGHLGSAGANIKSVRERLLGEEHGLLIYLPSRKVTHVFALDDGKLSHASLAPWHELVPHLKAHKDLLRRGRAATGTLAQLIPEGIEEQVQAWKSWTVVGADFLLNIPFESLQQSNGKLLGQVVALDSLGGVPLGLGLDRRAGQRAVASPSVGLSLFATLGHNVGAVKKQTGVSLASNVVREQDLKRIRSAYAGRVDGRIGEACTRAALIELGKDLARSSVVQFFVHGLYLPDHERGAVLALAADEAGGNVLFDCGDVEQYLQLSGLVVLSACGTSRGPNRLGDEGSSHLGGAFLRAGANCVILSGNDIPYQVAVDMSEALHQGLAQGMVPAEALRSARAKLAPHSSLGDQLHMARFQVIGLGHRAIQD